MAHRRFPIAWLVALVLPLVALPGSASAGRANAPIVVNSTVDPGDGTCDVTECTLREAITKANDDSGDDEIDFAIPGGGVHVIQPASALPGIGEQVTIDGFTQGGVGNSAHLIEIDGSGAGGSASGLAVGGADSVIRGLSIGNFSQNGIAVTTGGVTVEGNLIGINPGGSGIANDNDGVFVNGSSDVTIGGLTSVDRNVISNNTEHGISIINALSTGNLIEGNFIGTDITGASAEGNGVDGIDIEDASTTTIGGTAASARNVISASGAHGVLLTGSSVSGTVIQGNRIGTDLTGTVDLGNGGNGIFTDFSGAHDTTIGGTAAGAGNLISGNDEGIVLFSASNTVVQGNLIGTTADGMSALPNRGGIGVESAGVTIGGTAAGAGNLISGNTQRGIDFQSDHSVIQGNLVGTKADGIHRLGNGTEGISVNGSLDVLIGGTASGAGNVFAANGANGIRISGGDSTIQGNFIGTDKTATRALGNALAGVDIESGQRMIVGGSVAAARNVIRHNGTDGIVLLSGARNRIRRNLISANGSTANDLAIDLNGDGVTANDHGDGDTGPNGLQNFPALVSAVRGTTATSVKVTLNSHPNTKYVLDFFSNVACDPSGHGEAAVVLKTVKATTGASGNFAGVVKLPLQPKGRFITATATDPAGNTSELSACRAVT